MGEDRPALLWRAGGADRADARGRRRREALGLRAALPARAQLLHAATGSGGDAACHLYRLAAARLARWHRGGHAVHPARLLRHPCARALLCAVPEHGLHPGAVLRAQGGGIGDRRAGADEDRFAGAENPAVVVAGGGGLHRDLCLCRAVPADRSGGSRNWFPVRGPLPEERCGRGGAGIASAARHGPECEAHRSFRRALDGAGLIGGIGARFR